MLAATPPLLKKPKIVFDVAALYVLKSALALPKLLLLILIATPALADESIPVKLLVKLTAEIPSMELLF